MRGTRWTRTRDIPGTGLVSHAVEGCESVSERADAVALRWCGQSHRCSWPKKVGEHLGGYDGWSVDITDAVKDAARACQWRCCAINSRDAESHTVRPGAISTGMEVCTGMCNWFTRPRADRECQDHAEAGGNKATVAIKHYCVSFHPRLARDVVVRVEVHDPDGKVVYAGGTDQFTRFIERASRSVFFLVRDTGPAVYASPNFPSLYRCTVTFEKNRSRRTGLDILSSQHI